MPDKYLSMDPNAGLDSGAFRQWVTANNITDADSPQSFYDYRAAFSAGATRDASGHWPSDFKKPGHPNEIVGGFNTRTGERAPGTPRAKDAAELVGLGWDSKTAARLAALPEATGRGYLSTDPNAGDDDDGNDSGALATASRLGGAALGVSMAAAPTAVSVLSRVAALAGKAASARAAGVVPAVVAMDAAGDALRGDTKRAAQKAGGAVAASQVPRVVRAVQSATAPARSVAAGASRVLQATGAPYELPAVTVPGGMLSRMAGAASRFAGPVGLAVDAVTQPGHRAAGETAATTAARQADYARDYKAMVNRESGSNVITGSTVPEILASIRRYREGR